MTRDDLCPDCGHHLHRPSPCQWRECSCGHDTPSADQHPRTPTGRAYWDWDGFENRVSRELEVERFREAILAIEAEAASEPAEQSVPLDVERLADALRNLYRGFPAKRQAYFDAADIAAEYARLLPSEPSDSASLTGPALPDEGPIHWHSNDAAGAAIECHDSHSAARSAQVRQGSEAALREALERLLEHVELGLSITSMPTAVVAQARAALAASQPTAGEEKT